MAYAMRCLSHTLRGRCQTVPHPAQISPMLDQYRTLHSQGIAYALAVHSDLLSSPGVRSATHVIQRMRSLLRQCRTSHSGCIGREVPYRPQLSFPPQPAIAPYALSVPDFA
eukprot:562262-Rhodomonas_salina.2